MSSLIQGSFAHTFGRLTFDMPPGWREEVIVVMKPRADEGALEVRISRIELAPNETMTTLASRRLVEVTRTHPRVEVVSAIETNIQGRQAVRNEFRWRATDGEHTVKHCFIAGSPAGAIDHVFLVAGTAGERGRSELDRRFEQLLHSLTFAATPGASVASTSPRSP